jgi:SAM-dependent methyltransferase
MIENNGFCVCCDQDTIFRSDDEWLRDFYVCTNCGSIPRERALMRVIEMFYPNWRELTIHESSPVNRGASIKLKNKCKHYIPSQYWFERKPGEQYDGVYNVNLEKQHFENESFDLIVTQDVFEHIYKPKDAMQEIYRTLRHGGAHICTIPLVNKSKPTEEWSILKNGKIQFLHQPEYHGNPVDPQGSPVSYHYGYDLCFLVQKWSKLYSTIVYIDDINYGIKAELIEVIVMRKE